MTVARQHFDCVSSAPQRARSWLQRTLSPQLPAAEESTRLIHDAQLCASELLTNTIDAGCAAATLCVRLTGDRLRLSVIDDDAVGTPEVAAFDPSGPGGRGLLIRQKRVDLVNVEACHEAIQIFL